MLATFFISQVSEAQTVPRGMKYQAVARNLSGEILANQKNTLKIDLLTVNSGRGAGKTFYSETHEVTTDMLGLFTLVIGEGKSQGGSFDKVPWSSEDIWMQVSIKDKGQAAFSIISNSKLLAVPYAFHAATANALVSESDGAGMFPTVNTPGVPSQNWSLFGNSKTTLQDKLGTTDFADLIVVTNNIERLRITAGGNVNIASSLKVGADLTIDSSVYLNKVAGSTINYGPFTVDRMSPTYLTGTLTVDKATDLNSTLNVDGNTDLNSSLNVNNASPTHLTGSLTVDKATDLNSTLNVNGNTELNSTLNVNNASPTHLTGSLMVDKATDLKSTLNVDGNTGLNSSLKVNNASPTLLTGSLTVGQTTNLNSVLNVNNASISNLTGPLNVGGVSKLNGQVTISATLPPGESDINNYPLIVQGSRNGVSIKIQGATPNRNENFITFWDGLGEARGRIEGFSGTFEKDRSAFIALVNNANGQDSNSTASHDLNQPLPAAPTPLQNINNNYAFGALNATITLVQNILKFVINLEACIAGAGVLGDCDDVLWSGIDMAISAVQFAGYIAYNEGNPGVAYESGGADYAEWLPKSGKDEVMTFGDVVGVKGGVISKTFSGAEKFMVVSRNPGVIGGMPAADEKIVYEKIAFMGQVPVKVVGKVHKEDYILPSGNGDGMAMAVPPNKMHAIDFKRVIGIAWSESDSLKDFNYINTAVGINANDMAATVEDMQLVLNNIQLTLKKLDPRYKPSLYSLGERGKRYSGDYSKAPSFRETISSNLDMGKYANSTEALKEIQKYTYTQGMDLSQFKYLSQLMGNPTVEEAEKALDHYNKVLTKLQRMLITANKVSGSSPKK